MLEWFSYTEAHYKADIYKHDKTANGQLSFEKFHEAHKNLLNMLNVVVNISCPKTVYLCLNLLWKF